MSEHDGRRRKALLRPIVIAATLGALAFAAPGPASGASSTASSSPDDPLLPVSSLIVKYKPGVPAEVGGVVTGQNSVPSDVTLTEPRPDSGNTTVVELETALTSQEAEIVATALEADPRVEWAQPNRWMFPTAFPASPPDDADYNKLWGLWNPYGVRVGADATTMTPAWTTSRGDGIVVAVLDTGQIVHPDLGGVTVTNKAITSNVATLTTGTPHGFTTGDSVTVFGLGDSATAVNVSKKELTSNVATITTTADHGLAVGNTVTIDGVDSAVNVATRSRDDDVATITTTTNHGLVAGSIVTIAGVADTSFNGSFTVATAPTTTSFTYANPGPDVATIASVGTVASTIFDGIYTVTAVPSTTEFRYTSIAGTVASVASVGTATRSIFDGTHTITSTTDTTFTFSATSENVATTAAAGAAYRATGDANTLPGYDFVSGGSNGSAACSEGGPAVELVRAEGMTLAESNQDGDVVNQAVYGPIGRDAIPLDPGDWGRSYFCLPPEPNVQWSFRDSSWHGTHVAGTIAAVTNNAIGIAGVAPNAKVVPIRVLGYGGGQEADIAAGIRWAAGDTVPGAPANPNPAKIINMSLGGDGPCGRAYQSAIDEARARGSIIVVAAGNENQDVANVTPANCDGVIVVAATNEVGNRSSFSNFGSGITIAAPGGAGQGDPGQGIFSTVSSMEEGPGYPGEGSSPAIPNTAATTPSYAYLSGTSMATPHVSGVVALMLSAPGGPTTEAGVRSLLNLTAQPFANDSICDPATPSKTCGVGIANAAALTAPQLAGASPSSSGTSGGTRVTITGANLADVTAVQFGSTPAAFTVDSSTQITATAPPRSAGSAALTVRNISGRSNTVTFTYGDGSPPTPPGPGPAPSPTPTPAPSPTPTPLPSPDPFPVKPFEQDPVDSVRDLSPAQVRQLSAAELAQLPPRAFAVMSPAQVRALRPNQITNQIGRAQLRAITPRALRAMKPRTINALKPWQVRSLTPRQARELRPKQIAKLSPAKQRIIANKRA